jgi:hypothetical protein
MKVSFDLKSKLEIISEKAAKANKKVMAKIHQNARDACEAMVEAAREHTPHEGDGKRRGFNVISNSLQDSWHAEFQPSQEKNEVGTVKLENTKSYAIYVQRGHKVTKHFVPWLYKDGMGTISYETDHNQPMFGLVVGTKTPYVKGVDMIGPAHDAFNRVFTASTKKTLKIELDDVLDGKK